LLGACAGGSANPAPPPAPPTTATPPTPTAAPTANADPPPPPTPPDDSRAETSFNAKVYGRARKASGNLLISGTSLRLALAVPYRGARGDTQRELGAALEMTNGDVSAEIAGWQDAKGQNDLSIATRTWAEKSMPLVSGFEAEPIDFKNAADDSRKKINAWVAEKTSDKIKDLLPSGSVDARSRLVVTNAIYMKARWSNPFVVASTKDEPFHLDAKTTKNVPTMHAIDTHAYAEAPGGVKLVALTYRASDLSMLFVVADDLAKVEESLSEETLRGWTSSLRPQRVSLSLPRFTFKSGAPMNTILQDLGVKTAFTDHADFSGISESKDIALSQVVQQTFVSVDEQGTEAAAATGVVMRTTSLAMGPIVEVKLDRPFLFFVRDAKRGRILFVGRVADPSLKGS
jgi:serpin B